MNSEHLQMLFLDAIANVIPCYIKQLCILQRALYIYIIQKIKNGNKETNIARGTTDPGYWLFNLSYLSS